MKWIQRPHKGMSVQTFRRQVYKVVLLLVTLCTLAWGGMYAFFVYMGFGLTQTIPLLWFFTVVYVIAGAGVKYYETAQTLRGETA